MKRAVIGIGNPHEGKDRAGIIIARRVASVCKVDGVILYDLFELVDKLLEYDFVVIVDTIFGSSEGKVHVFELDELREVNPPFRLTHSIDLTTALKLAHELFGDEIAETFIVLLEVKNLNDESEEFRRGLMEAVKVVITLLTAKKLYSNRPNTNSAMMKGPL